MKLYVMNMFTNEWEFSEANFDEIKNFLKLYIINFNNDKVLLKDLCEAYTYDEISKICDKLEIFKVEE